MKYMVFTDMDNTSHQLSDRQLGFSFDESNTQLVGEQETPPAKRARIELHSVSVVSHRVANVNTLTTEKKTYQCNQCHYSSNKKHNLVQHKRRRHNVSGRVVKLHYCARCSYSTTNKGNVARHEQTHQTAKNYKCDQCAYITNTQNNLDRHKKGHGVSNEYQCAYCTHCSKDNSNLIRHQQTHIVEKTYRCPQCDYRGNSQRNLTGHKKIHQVAMDFWCDECNYGTNYLGSLKRHKNSHQKSGDRIKNFLCEQCGYNTDRRSYLKSHIKKIHAIVSNENKVQVVKQKPAPSKVVDLNMVTSKPPKEYQCKECDYSSDYKRNLANHIKKIHALDSNENDAEVFKQKPAPSKVVDLNMVTSKPPKKYQCKECDYSSDYERNLKRHINKMHPIAPNENDLQIVKHEPPPINVVDLNHRIDNQARLWGDEDLIKKEVEKVANMKPKPKSKSKSKSSKKTHTYFVELGLLKNKGDKKRVRKAISFYKRLEDEERERYLNERMSVRKNDGSYFSELEGQKEVFARRGIERWEILGHYAGKQYTEVCYRDDVSSMNATRGAIDTYSFTTTEDQFICGFRLGNVTTLINACTTYSESEKGRKLPDKNVSFMRHLDRGRYLVFLVALNDIEAGATLWTDYGEEFWAAKCSPIEISDDEG